MFDTEVRGFGIRKYADGSASYIVKYAVNGQPTRKTLGPVRKGNLKKMRSLADEVKARARIGQDVIGEQKAAAAARRATQGAVTVGALVKVFLAEREAATRTIKDGKPVTPTLRWATHENTARYLNLHCAALHNLVIGTITKGTQLFVVVDIDAEINDPKRLAPINSSHKLKIIDRDHVKGVINVAAETRGKVTADRCRTALSTFFAWAIDKGFCDLNPTMGIKTNAGKSLRHRTLSAQERAEVWHACLDDDYGKIVRLLLLTGQRKTEIGGLRWSEINYEYDHKETGEDGQKRECVMPVIMLPPPRCKTGRKMIERGMAFHLVPLSEQALQIIKSVPRGERDQLFGRSGCANGFQGWSVAKKMLDQRINDARAKAGLGPMPHWTIHDLSRSLSTHANDLDLGRDVVIEAVLNHVVPGVGGKYNHAKYLLQKREALARWGAHIAKLVSQPAMPSKEAA